MENWKKTLKKDISEIVNVNKDDLDMAKDDLYKLFLEYPEIVKKCHIANVSGSFNALIDAGEGSFWINYTSDLKDITDVHKQLQDKLGLNVDVLAVTEVDS